MAGRIVLEDADRQPRWDRFAVEFEDGSSFALRDRRRLGRAVLNPDYSHVGPDAALATRAQFRQAIGRCHTLERARIGGRTTYWCPACQR
jgi:formamidopyrimidine-DNA glycosylase